MSIDHFSFVVLDEEPTRLDRCLVAYHAQYSRAFYQGLIEKALVSVNGKIQTKVSFPVSSGDTVVMGIEEKETLLDLVPENIPLDKIYEDPCVLVINKPRGLVVHPAPGHFHGTVVHALLHEMGERLKQEFPEEPWRPGIVHRLDKDTSGLLITAKTRQAKALFCELFASKRLRKQYLAVCIGKPKQECIRTGLARHPVKRKEMAVSVEGKEAITHCSVLACNGKLSLVRLSPETGRTHQLRVHMKYIGTPILGDPVYGSSSMNAGYDLDKQQLHAYSLDFVHPFTTEAVRLTAPLPVDMKHLIIKEFGKEDFLDRTGYLDAIFN